MAVVRRCACAMCVCVYMRKIDDRDFLLASLFLCHGGFGVGRGGGHAGLVLVTRD